MSTNRRGKPGTKTPPSPKSAVVPPPQSQPKPAKKAQPASAPPPVPVPAKGPQRQAWDLKGLSQEDIVMPATLDESATIYKLEIQVAEINTSLKFVKWIGALLALAAMVFIGFEYASVQRLVRIEDAILAVQKDAADMRSDLKERNREIAGSLDRIEKSLARNQSSPDKTPR
jgi:hypothetical protein